MKTVHFYTYKTMPTLRIGQSDLKCKNGCDYYGNPQWQGYCSKCHREQMQRQRKAEKVTISTLPKADQRKTEKNPKLTSHSSFSKFEEKRLRQSETLKKANILKFNVFKKSNNTEEHEVPRERRPAEVKVPGAVAERMRRDGRARFPALGAPADRDCRAFVHSFITDVIKCAPAMGVDELSERVQRQYQRFLKHMDTSPHFAAVDAETKELLIDFIEKHAMSYLHDLPSVVFSPSGTDDERADRAMSERIQQLSWVGEKHLDCRLNRSDVVCSKLLHKAISEFLGMDAARWPGGKLAGARRGCAHVVALCAAAAKAPPSADDLLPALIFTILKANPPRLVSNINFVTRFCHAPRLMTGEAGYYFTNLCCAVSFIENLTAESLSMDKKEFECYMAMPASIGGSAWAAALSLCAEMSEAEEQRNLALDLLNGAQEISRQADKIADDAVTFENEIQKKVHDVLNKTPLEVKARREIPSLRKIKDFESILIDFDSAKEGDEVKTLESSCLGDDIINKTEEENMKATNEQKPTILVPQPSKEIRLEVVENLGDGHESSKESNYLELLTPSPLGFTSFTSRSIDDLMSPEEYNAESMVPGLSAVNYDIDLSDLSGENSLAEEKDFNLEQKDPFSPEEMKNTKSLPLDKHDQFSIVSHAFNQFNLADVATSNIVPVPSSIDPFTVMSHANDPFSPNPPSPKNIDSIKYAFNNKGENVISPELIQRVNYNTDVNIDPFSPITNQPLDFEQIEKKFNMTANAGMCKSLYSNVDPFTAVSMANENRPYSNNSTVESSAAGPISLLDNDSSSNTLLLPTPLQPQSNSKS